MECLRRFVVAVDLDELLEAPASGRALDQLFGVTEGHARLGLAATPSPPEARTNSRVQAPSRPTSAV